MSRILWSVYFGETMKKCIHTRKSSVFPKSCTDLEEHSTERGMVKTLNRWHSLAVKAAFRGGLAASERS